MRHLDWPPVWTAAFVALAWAAGHLLPWGLPATAGRLAGAALVVAGLGLMALAAQRMQRARTTMIPRREPSALVTGGIFAFSRNPIYLGDALVVAGAVLWWGALWALVLVPLFAHVIARRFILPEERVLAARFGPAWHAWSARTGRWFPGGPGRNSG